MKWEIGQLGLFQFCACCKDIFMQHCHMHAYSEFRICMLKPCMQMRVLHTHIYRLMMHLRWSGAWGQGNAQSAAHTLTQNDITSTTIGSAEHCSVSNKATLCWPITFCKGQVQAWHLCAMACCCLNIDDIIRFLQLHQRLAAMTRSHLWPASVLRSTLLI